MGAWGSGTFENDGALDWVIELEAADDSGFLQATFNSVLAAQDTLEADDCERALAAAEVVAALLDRPGAGLTSEAAEWVAVHRHEDVAPLAATALRAISRIRQESELQELWAEDDDTLAEWEASLDNLIVRLEESS